jgi:hypothetical protein
MTALIFFIIFVLWLFIYTCLSMVTEQVIKNEYWLCIINILSLVLSFCISVDVILSIFNVELL